MDWPTQETKIELHELSQMYYLFNIQKSFKLDKNSKKEADCFLRKTRRDSLIERIKSWNSCQQIELNKLYQMITVKAKFNDWNPPSHLKMLIQW